MSDTQLPVSEYVKQGIFIIAIIAIAIFGIKTCRKFQKKKQIVIELTSHASESAAYEQFYQDNANQNLLKALYQMQLGVELGMTPSEILDKVMQKDEGELFSTENTEKLPVRQELIREALLSNYDNCLKLGLFDDQLNLNAMENGEIPSVTKGPAEGEEIVIQQILPASVLPGADKLLPNLSISPPLVDGQKKPAKPTDFEVARAKRLAQQLANADLIENEVYAKVLEYYEKLAKGELEAAEKPEEDKKTEEPKKP
ncbi:hypothetical protein NT6N_08820 [Oceaniferula spumae]|uniref:Uncharacterized protein n=1 Tax=Oceaniferula spumae TaxID=2979115 RepID=A0AAT9FIT8_9BACT